MTAPKIDTQAPAEINVAWGPFEDIVVPYHQDDSPNNYILASLSAAREAAAWIAGRDAAAKLNDQQIQDYVSEHGTYDGSTGITEFPGDGEEWVGDREELSDAIRALTPPTDPAAALDRLIAERVREMWEAWALMDHFAVVLREDDGKYVSVKQEHYEAVRALLGSKEGRDAST